MSTAEIMGWRKTGGYGPSWWWVDADGNQHETVGPDPSVDDMLAWLRGRGAPDGLHFYINGADYTVRAWLDEGDCRVAFGPTLHAALEAAVRAVAKAAA